MKITLYIIVIVCLLIEQGCYDEVNINDSIIETTIRVKQPSYIDDEIFDFFLSGQLKDSFSYIEKKYKNNENLKYLKLMLDCEMEYFHSTEEYFQNKYGKDFFMVDYKNDRLYQSIPLERWEGYTLLYYDLLLYNKYDCVSLGLARFTYGEFFTECDNNVFCLMEKIIVFRNSEGILNDDQDVLFKLDSISKSHPNWMFPKYKSLAFIENDSIKYNIVNELKINSFLSKYCDRVLKGEKEFFTIDCTDYDDR